MFKKIRTRIIKQDDPHVTKKWFRNEAGDLFVWLDAAGQVIHFQLTFASDDRPVLAEWKKGSEVKLGEIDEPSGPTLKGMGSPTVQFASGGDANVFARAAEYVRTAQGDLPDDVRATVASILDGAAVAPRRKGSGRLPKGGEASDA